MKEKQEQRVYTLSAFLLGYILIDCLNGNEQSQLGNWFMLVGQTLCTSGAYKFRSEWEGHLGGEHDDIHRMLKVTSDSIDRLNEIIK